MHSVVVSSEEEWYFTRPTCTICTLSFFQFVQFVSSFTQFLSEKSAVLLNGVTTSKISLLVEGGDLPAFDQGHGGCVCTPRFVDCHMLIISSGAHIPPFHAHSHGSLLACRNARLHLLVISSAFSGLLSMTGLNSQQNDRQHFAFPCWSEEGEEVEEEAGILCL